MRKHLNTLYVSTQGTFLGAEGETVVVKIDGAVKMRVPLHMLEGVICFGNVIASPFLMGRCADRNIGFSFLTERGRFLARVQGSVSGNVLLRREQYRWADDKTKSCDIAKTCVCAKVANCRRVLQRAVRDKPSEDGNRSISLAVESLDRSLVAVGKATSLDTVRGLEGDGAKVYFSVFNRLIRVNDELFRFCGRNRRPPLDPTNALLSFLYTLVCHDVNSALSAVGLDPQVGFLHRDRPGRPGLALDLMEELRPFLADRVVLSLINRRQVKASGFEKRETGAVYVDDDTRKTILVEYQRRKDEEILHPFLGERVTIGMIAHLQALLLARYIRGDLDAYPAFFWK